MSADPVDNLLSRLANVKQASSSRWMCTCPTHDDDKQSLQVTRGDDGRALLKCFAGCTSEGIVAKVGLTMADLFVKEEPTRKVDYGRVVARYDYLDEQGVKLFQVRRTSTKQFPTYRPDGTPGIEGIRRVLYRLPELLASPGKTVCIPEGEKDVDRLRALGLVATCNPGGGGKWRDEFALMVAGRHILIFEDNDPTGRDHVLEVAASVHPQAASVRIVRLEGLPPKGDVSDWLDMGHTLDELKDVARSAPLYVSGEQPASIEEPPEPDKWEPKPLSQLRADTEQLEWLWHGYIAKGMITLFTALWKSGKTTLLSYLFKAMDANDPGDIGGEACTPGKVLLVSEESPRHWVDRRDALHIGDHVHIIEQPFRGAPTKQEWDSLLLHISGRQYDLVVIDSLHNLWPVKSEKDNSEVLQVLSPLRLITQSGAALLLMGHPSKFDQTEGRSPRGGGALAAFCDMLVEMRRYNPEDLSDTRRALTYLGRFDEAQPDTVIDYVAGVGYTGQGTRSQAGRTERKEIIKAVLPTKGAGMTLEDILKAWPEESQKPTKRQVGLELDAMARDVRALRTGKGTATDPFRYRLSATDPVYYADPGQGFSDIA